MVLTDWFIDLGSSRRRSPANWCVEPWRAVTGRSLTRPIDELEREQRGYEVLTGWFIDLIGCRMSDSVKRQVEYRCLVTDRS